MHTVTVTVYEFNELSDKSKETARGWWREASIYDQWWDSTSEDARHIGFEIIEFDVNRRMIEGKLTTDGLNVAKSIREIHGEGCPTYKAMEVFFANVTALRMRHGRDFEDASGYDDACIVFQSELGKCYLSMLVDESEYVDSDEYVDETIVANEYTFTEGGERFD